MCDVTRLMKGGPRKFGAMSWRTANWELEKKHTPMDGVLHGRQAPLIQISRPYAKFKSILGYLCLLYHPIESILPAFAFTTFLDKTG